MQTNSLQALRLAYRLAKQTGQSNYLDALHPGQRRIAEHPARFKVLDCGRKWGKTDFAGILENELMHRGLWVASVAPNYKTTQAIWDVLMRLNPERQGVNSSLMSIVLPNGGKYRGWSLDTTAADNIRPFEYDFIVVDEAAFIDALFNKWTKILLPTLAKRQGKAVFMSSPQGFNDFWKLFQFGVSETEPDWMSWRFPTVGHEFGNPHIDPAEIELQRRLLPVRTFMQEYEGAFEEDAGAVYDTFSVAPDGNVTTDAEYLPGVPVAWWIDDGYVYGDGPGTATYHPRVILLAQYTGSGGANIFAEYVACGELSEVSIQNVKDMGYPLPDIAYIDSSAAELRGRLWAANITTMGATHKVDEGIKNVRRLVRDGQGVCLLKIHPRCTHTKDEMQKYRMDAHASPPKPLKIDDHCPDAIRYGCHVLRNES